jgi:hypothetical protein
MYASSAAKQEFERDVRTKFLAKHNNPTRYHFKYATIGAVTHMQTKTKQNLKLCSTARSQCRSVFTLQGYRCPVRRRQQASLATSHAFERIQTLRSQKASSGAHGKDEETKHYTKMAPDTNLGTVCGHAVLQLQEIQDKQWAAISDR